MTAVASLGALHRSGGRHSCVLPPISLADLNDVAALQNRVDRKYVVTGPELSDVIDRLASRLAVLEIDGRRSFEYRSVYFDTDDLQSFIGAARSRRRRFKVRTRTYVDSGEVMLEVKRRDGRGTTVKTRRPHSGSRSDQLDSAAVDFVDAEVGRPGLGRELRPTLLTSYRRTTLVDLDDVARVTIDADCGFWRPDGSRGGLDQRLIVETKSSGRPSTIDRTLWRLGIRPTTISKYGTGLAALDPTLPSNKWHRTISRYVT